MRWTGQDLINLLTLPIVELCEKYPDQTIENLKRRKRQYKQKGVTVEKQPNQEKTPDELDRLAKAFKDAGVEFTADELSTADRAGFHVGYIRNSEGEIEYTKPLPHVDFGKKSRNALIVEPVVAARISQPRYRPLKRTYESIFVFSDSQIGFRRIDNELVPLHDEAAIMAAQMLAKYLRPNYVVDAGDTTDFGELSTHFDPDSDHFQGTLQPSLQASHDMLAGFTAATPGAERFLLDSNHVKRLTTYILKNAAALYNVKMPGDRYSVLSYPGLLKLDQIGWNFSGGYGPGLYDHKGEGRLLMAHGTDAVSNGSTAAKVGKKYNDANFVQGHAHRMESQYHTDRHGRMFGAFVVGALCRRDGIVPSYWNAIDAENKPVVYQENWQNGVLHIKDYGEGRMQFDQIPIYNGVITYDNHEFDGNKPIHEETA